MNSVGHRGPIEGREMLVTLPTDRAVGEEIIVSAYDMPNVVCGYRIPVGYMATFRLKRFLWWKWWTPVAMVLIEDI